MERFSKKQFTEYVYGRIEDLSKQWGFTSYTGTVQVLPTDSKSRQMAYGEVMALEAALDVFSIPHISYGKQR